MVYKVLNKQDTFPVVLGKAIKMNKLISIYKSTFEEDFCPIFGAIGNLDKVISSFLEKNLRPEESIEENRVSILAIIYDSIEQDRELSFYASNELDSDTFSEIPDVFINSLNDFIIGELEKLGIIYADYGFSDYKKESKEYLDSMYTRSFEGGVVLC